ncbi:hypothetical protein CN373_05110 [Bacillus cereus]|nr:hypothetical protein CN373_05110 [Bacillus cereus]PFO81503.1 hypothetical protein COJ77_15820 [Bacillus cereus]PGZ21023.1 hypothetical protein COE46_01040 [Bacillus cereus]
MKYFEMRVLLSANTLISSLCFHKEWGEKRTDRFYAWVDDLSHLKKKRVYVIFKIGCIQKKLVNDELFLT